MRALLLFLLAFSPLANAQTDSLRTVEFFELVSQRSGIGALDTLRLNLFSDYDSKRGTLYIAGTSVVESLDGETQPRNAIVRLYQNAHERMIPDALIGYVDVCRSGLGWHQVNVVSGRGGTFSMAMPIAPEELEEILSCLSITANTSKGTDAVGAVAYGV